jgi:peroxiredoxin
VIAQDPVLPSAAMTCAARLASAASLLAVLAVLACQPAPTTAPDPVAADPGGPTIAGSSAGESEGALDADEDGDGETRVAANDASSGSDDGPELATESTSEGADPTPTTAPTTTAAREPLPKPLHKPSDGRCIKKFAVGEQVKGFRLPSLTGDKTISPAGYRNRVVLLNFWATWCKPCLAELPEFDRLYRKYRKHGMTLVAVTTDEDAKAVQTFVDQHKLAAKIALAGEKAAGEYGRPNFPFSFVVDGHGTIVAAFDYVDDACLGDLEQVIRDALEQLD